MSHLTRTNFSLQSNYFHLKRNLCRRTIVKHLKIENCHVFWICVIEKITQRQKQTKKSINILHRRYKVNDKCYAAFSKQLDE